MPFATSGLTFVVLRKMSIPLHTTQWLRRRSDNVYIYYSHVFWIMAKKNYSNVLWCGIETWRNRTIHQGAVYNTLTKRYSTPWNTGFLKMTKGYCSFNISLENTVGADSTTAIRQQNICVIPINVCLTFFKIKKIKWNKSSTSGTADL